MSTGDIAKLAKLLPPPRARGTAGALDAAEALLGTALPPDYRAFVEAYGAGRIGGLVDVFDLGDGGRGYPEVHALAFRMSLFHRNMRIPGVASLPQTNGVPYPIFPEPGGLLPWGVTTTGDALLWVTEGEPERWTVVAETAAYRYLRFAGSMTSFLAALLEGSLHWEAIDAQTRGKPLRATFAPFKSAASPAKKAPEKKTAAKKAPAKKAAAKKTAAKKTAAKKTGGRR